MLKALTFIKWLKIEKVSLCYFSYASIEKAKILGLNVTHGTLSTDKRYGMFVGVRRLKKTVCIG